MNGYLHPLYANSLSQFGKPIELTDCGGWLLERKIQGSNFSDAMGCYPLFCCLNWSRLASDLDKLAGRFVTVSLVVDTFAPVTESDLAHCFQVVKPFKEHLVIDVNEQTEQHVTKHHRYYARQALKQIQIELVENPSVYLDEWVQLYDILVERHRLRGVKAFSASSFAAQLQVPGIVMFRATHNGVVVGMHLWFIQSGVAYSHLAAYSENGYSLGAAYALYWFAIHSFKEHYSEQVQWIDIGSGAGIGAGARDGLTQFKRGWAKITKIKYFCGRICQPETYELMARETVGAGESYFPAYRSGELA